MNEKQLKILTEEAPTTDSESHDLFDALTRGKPIASENLKIIDLDTGETAWLWTEDRDTIVVSDDYNMERVQGGTLTMTPQEEKDEISPMPTGTTSGLPSAEEQDDYIPLQQAPSPGLTRILARASKSLERALAWEKEHGPVLDNLDKAAREIFGDIELSPEEWEAIRDAPYDPY